MTIRSRILKEIENVYHVNKVVTYDRQITQLGGFLLYEVEYRPEAMTAEIEFRIKNVVRKYTPVGNVKKIKSSIPNFERIQITVTNHKYLNNEE